MFKHINKNNLHHAYLIEGDRDILVEVQSLMDDLEIETKGNPDFYFKSYDSLKIDDARSLSAIKGEKSFVEGKRIILIYTNSFLIEAQNSLLKMFEEPIENTHLFLVTPDTRALLPTLKSRFYFISTRDRKNQTGNDAELFLKMPLSKKLDFIKVMTAKKEDDESSDDSLDSVRAKSAKFLDELELFLHQSLTSVKSSGKRPSKEIFNQIIKARIYLRQPGSAPKTLLESVAIMLG